MDAELVTRNLWPTITKAAEQSKFRSYGAVAYFGKGGAKMLPLRTGSILIVDASETAVKSGQDCPAELVILYHQGVRIFSHPKLHAKIYVIGKRLFIGSANVLRILTKSYLKWCIAQDILFEITPLLLGGLLYLICISLSIIN